MKYIVLRTKFKSITQLMPVIFPNHWVHSQVAASLIHMCGVKQNKEAEIVSAGFWDSVNGCHGESTSLGVKSRGVEDTELIATHDYTHGLEI